MAQCSHAINASDITFEAYVTVFHDDSCGALYGASDAPYWIETWRSCCGDAQVLPRLSWPS